MNEDTYQGIPLSRLEINDVDWTVQGEHIRTRTQRYPDRREFDIEPEWATEAALDPGRLIATTGGLSIEIIGRSVQAPSRSDESGGRILKIWVIPADLQAGSWIGTSACEANGKERQKYGDITRGEDQWQPQT